MDASSRVANPGHVERVALVVDPEQDNVDPDEEHVLPVDEDRAASSAGRERFDGFCDRTRVIEGKASPAVERPPSTRRRTACSFPAVLSVGKLAHDRRMRNGRAVGLAAQAGEHRGSGGHEDEAELSRR